MARFQVEKPKVYKLLHWYLRQTRRGSIFLEGYLKSTDLLWRSSCIESRISARQLCTSSGSIYQLVGDADLEVSLELGLPCDLVEAFKNGFPEDWENYTRTLPAKKTCCTNKSNMELQTTRFDTSTFVRTRSGRIVIPRLAYWCGERIIIQKNGDFYISQGYFAAFKPSSNETINSIKNQLRNQHAGIQDVTSVPRTPNKRKAHSIDQVGANSQRKSRTKSSIAKKTACSSLIAVEQKENLAPKLKLNLTLHNTSTKKSKVTRASGRSGRIVSDAKKQAPATAKLRAGELQETPPKSSRKMRARHDSVKEKTDLRRLTRNMSKKLEPNKFCTETKSGLPKSAKRKIVHDEPAPKRARRNVPINRKSLLEDHEEQVSKFSKGRKFSRDKFGQTLDKSKELDKVIRKKSPSETKNVLLTSTKKKIASDASSSNCAQGSLFINSKSSPEEAVSKTYKRRDLSRDKAEKALNKASGPDPSKDGTNVNADVIRKTPRNNASKPEITKEKSCDRSSRLEVICKKPAPRCKVSKPVLSQEKDIDQDKATGKSPARQQMGAKSRSSTKKLPLADGNCLAVTPCTKAIEGSNKKMARPGTLRYEEDIRRFIREHNQDDDDDFLATTPFRGKFPAVNISESIFRKFRQENDDDDVNNMLTPKIFGGLPSPFTPKKTPDISGGIPGQCVQELNMKQVDQLVYRVRKRRKGNLNKKSQNTTRDENNAKTPIVHKLSNSLSDYIIEALSSHESDDDEDKDYYFSDEEMP